TRTSRAASAPDCAPAARPARRRGTSRAADGIAQSGRIGRRRRAVPVGHPLAGIEQIIGPKPEPALHFSPSCAATHLRHYPADP
ncbi:hypothetical protein, partial [Klebsiella oxytoca]|uniref:hypothetical protein n=1 Tax=Klebsiella oxytoca TaxID=571 RepID=UPI001952F544